MIKLYLEVDADPDDLSVEEPYYARLEVDGRSFDVTDIRAVEERM